MDHYKEAVAMEQEEKLLLTSEEAAAMLRKSAMVLDVNYLGPSATIILAGE
jgi:hypothetical protein